VDRLVGLLSVALRSLASAEEGEECIFQVKLHEPFDSEDPVVEAKPALQRLQSVLDAVTCDMNKVCGLEGRGNVVLSSGIIVVRVYHDSYSHSRVDDLTSLVFDIRKRRQSFVIRCDDQES
jgi:hypothetical protein